MNNGDLEVFAVPNHLKNGGSKHFARSHSSKVVTYEDVVNAMASGRTTITKPDILGTLELSYEEIAKLLAEGKYVKSPIGSYYVCASGSLDSADEPFNYEDSNNDHELHIHFKPNRDFEQQIARKMNIVRIKSASNNTPILGVVENVRTGEEFTGSPGDFIIISGHQLKFDKKDADCGIFFINGSENRAEQYAKCSGTEIIAEIPKTLPPGDYKLEIKIKPSNKEILKSQVTAPFKII